MTALENALQVNSAWESSDTRSKYPVASGTYYYLASSLCFCLFSHWRRLSCNTTIVQIHIWRGLDIGAHCEFAETETLSYVFSTSSSSSSSSSPALVISVIIVEQSRQVYAAIVQTIRRPLSVRTFFSSSLFPTSFERNKAKALELS